MAKSGRKPKGEYSGKSLVFSTRITPQLRKALEKAATASGRSVSQEVERRLSRSFIEDDNIVDLFGSRQTYRVMRMMADAIHICQRPGAALGHPDEVFDWITNPAAFQMARQAIISILDMIAPPGREWSEADMKAASALGNAVAGALWEKVRLAEKTLLPERKSRASAYRADLEDVLPRTADEIHAKELKRKATSAVKALRGTKK